MYHASTLVIDGGTIFNGGAMPSSKCTAPPGGAQPASCTGGHGILLEAGSLTLSGAQLRFNKGVAVAAGPGADSVTITGCQLHHNRQAIALNISAEHSNIPQPEPFPQPEPVDGKEDGAYAVTGNVVFSAPPSLAPRASRMGPG